MATLFSSLGNPTITPELKQSLTAGVLQKADGRSVSALASEENELLVELLRLRAQESRKTTAPAPDVSVSHQGRGTQAHANSGTH